MNDDHWRDQHDQTWIERDGELLYVRGDGEIDPGPWSRREVEQRFGPLVQATTKEGCPATVTETIRADQLSPGRMVMPDGRIETVTVVDRSRAGFVQFYTDRRDDTNLPYTYHLADTLTALTLAQIA
jgi:hypothetical protein